MKSTKKIGKCQEEVVQVIFEKAGMPTHVNVEEAKLLGVVGRQGGTKLIYFPIALVNVSYPQRFPVATRCTPLTILEILPSDFIG